VINGTCKWLIFNINENLALLYVPFAVA
jgi:hypothetical protein